MIFKSLVMFLYSVTVQGQALLSLSAWKAAMDTGVDEYPLDRVLAQTKNTNIDEEDSLYKLYLYQRVKMDFNNNSTVTLHYGIDISTFISTAALPFQLDIGFNHILINMNSHECVDEENCHKLDEGKRDTHVYNSTAYSYFNSTSFLGVNRVRPGEITVEKNEDIANFYSLPMRFYDNVEGLSHNVLGLGPNSPIWEYWKRIYHFPGKHINVTMCYNTDNEYVLYDSYIDRESEIMFGLDESKNAEKTNQPYVFKANLIFKTGDKEQEGERKICLSNKDNLMMKLKQSLLDDLKAELCTDPNNCVKNSDLKNNPKLDFQITVADSAKPDKKFNTKFLLSAIYEVEDDKIRWKVQVIIPTDYNDECDIMLEKEFLKEKYLLMSYNIDDPASILVGFKLMMPSDFTRFDFYSVTMFVLIIATIALFIVYMVLNHSLNKLIEKEEERQKAEE